MNGSLVPEVRTDKNGHSSTKWVKPDFGANSNASSLPAPKPVMSDHQRKQHEALAYEVTVIVDRIEREDAEYDGEEPRIGYDELSEQLSGLETRTLAAIRDNIPTADGEEMFVTDLLLGTANDEKAIRRIMTFLPYFTDYPTVEQVQSITAGLYEYGVFEVEDELPELTGSKLETARSLCKVVNALSHLLPSDNKLLTGTNLHISDPELVQVVLDHPFRGDDIAELITTRETTDATFIRGYLENGTRLAEGML